MLICSLNKTNEIKKYCRKCTEKRKMDNPVFDKKLVEHFVTTETTNTENLKHQKSTTLQCFFVICYCFYAMLHIFVYNEIISNQLLPPSSVVSSRRKVIYFLQSHLLYLRRNENVRKFALSNQMSIICCRDFNVWNFLLAL